MRSAYYNVVHQDNRANWQVRLPAADVPEAVGHADRSGLAALPHCASTGAGL
jgi:hypothetical protein